MNIKLKTDFLIDINQEKMLESYQAQIANIFNKVQNKTALGSEMLGWVEWINKDHSKTIQKMVQLREKWISLGVKTVVVVGIGGSYMGARAGLEFSTDTFGEKKLNVIFVPTFSSFYLGSLLKKLENEKFALVCVSKSGTTLEAALGFRLLRELLYKKEKQAAKELIATVTDKTKGVLRQITDQNDYVNFLIEDDIGGRFSTLTAVGLLPNVLAGVDVAKFLVGAQKAYKELYNGNLKNNTAAQYAAYRHFLYTQKNLKTECLCSYDPELNFMIEQAKQLLAESEGKNNKGLMPILMNFTTDLHSVGQLIQDGDKSFFETIFLVQEPKYDLKVPTSSFQNDDQLDWLANKTVDFINKQAFQGTIEAHTFEGKVNNLVVLLPDWSCETFGYFYYWLCIATMFSAYLLDVNPFDQPGVENYKKRMFKLLGKK